jgi:hypothetical protein
MNIYLLGFGKQCKKVPNKLIIQTHCCFTSVIFVSADKIKGDIDILKLLPRKSVKKTMFKHVYPPPKTSTVEIYRPFPINLSTSYVFSYIRFVLPTSFLKECVRRGVAPLTSVTSQSLKIMYVIKSVLCIVVGVSYNVQILILLCNNSLLFISSVQNLPMHAC